MQSKKEICINYLSKNPFFICPYCHESLVLNDNNLKCINNHNFDIGKKGELFLLKTGSYKESSIYNKKLFLNRREFIKNNFYKNIYDIVSNIINQFSNNEIIILDLGCGEGIHSKKIQEQITTKNNLIGIDISKSAINLATDYISNNNIYIVGDTNNLPVNNNSIDVVIDFLSPFNTSELKRVLKDHGIIIKISPGVNYLKELKNKEYVKESEVKNNIEKNFNIFHSYKFEGSFELNKEQLNNLINMTPVSNEKLYNDIKNITIDLNIYVLTKK